MKMLLKFLPAVVVLTTLGLQVQAASDIEESARFSAALKHLMNCGLRSSSEFSGLAVWIGDITKSDIDTERQKIAGLRGWVAVQSEPNRTAYRDALAYFDKALDDANDEVVNHTIKKRQAAYNKNLSAVSGRSDEIYRSMQSPCHSTGLPKRSDR